MKPPRAPRDPEAPLWRNLSRNVTGILLFEFLWGMGLPFGLYVAMVPAYLTALGASKSLMGFVQSFWTILIPLQLLGGHFFSSHGRVHALMRFVMLATGLRLLYDAAALFLPGLWTTTSLTWFFALACAAYISLYVVGQSIYMGVLTDNIPRRRRGWIFGLRTLFLGAGGILTGFGASWVLHHWASPVNYKLSFFICDLIWTMSGLSLFLLKDRPKHAPSPRARRGAPRREGFLMSLRGKLSILLANPNYRIFIFFHMLNSVAFTITTFIIPFSKEKLGIPDSLLAWLSVLFLAANAAFGSLLGRLADKAGYRSVGALQSLLLVAFFLIAVSARSFAAICVAYSLCSLVNMSSQFMLVNMSVELCPSIGVTDLTALGGTLLLPVVATAAPLAGMLIDRTGSYSTVFFIGVTIAAIALGGFALLVREPRTGRIYVIKQIAMR
jgi:MFS family permease